MKRKRIKRGMKILKPFKALLLKYFYVSTLFLKMHKHYFYSLLVYSPCPNFSPSYSIILYYTDIDCAIVASRFTIVINLGQCFVSNHREKFKR